MSPASAIDVGSSRCTGEATVTSPCRAAVDGTVSDNLAGVKPLQCRANGYALATSEYAPGTKDQGSNNSSLALQL